MMNSKSNFKTLDVGCGIRQRGLDIRVDIFRSPSTNLLASAEYLPFKKNCISRLECHEVLEHLRKPEKALKDFNRILAIGGVAVLEFPKEKFANSLKAIIVRAALNFPFTFLIIPHIVKSVRQVKRKDPRIFHKSIISVKLVSEFLEVKKVSETQFLPTVWATLDYHGKRLFDFLIKPKIFLSYELLCTKKARAK